MAGICSSDLKNSCRLCLSNRGSLAIFESCVDELGPLSSRILACLSVEICQADSLPKHICQRCLSLMNVWYFFKMECDSAQQKLKKWHSIISNPPDQEDILEDDNFILREVVNIKLEPEDNCIDATSSIHSGACIQDIHSRIPSGSCTTSNIGGSDVACNSVDGLLEIDEHQRHSDVMNLVISETSSVALHCAIDEPDTVPSVQIEDMDDENLIRLAIQDDSGSSLHNVFDDDDINITYEGTGNPNRSILEITLDESNDGVSSVQRFEEDVINSSHENPQIAPPEELQGDEVNNLNVTLMAMKREACDVFQQQGIHIKKEIEDFDENLDVSGGQPLKTIAQDSSSFTTFLESDAKLSSSSKSKKFHCSLCNLPFRSRKQRDIHEKRRHRKKVPSAGNSTMNDQVYNYSSIVLSKVSNELFDEATSYCKICKRKYSKARFWRHIKDVHFQEDPFKCTVCKKVFSGRRELVTHRVRTVSKYCREGRIPEVNPSFITTMYDDPSGKADAFKCNVCSEFFADLSLAEKHTRIHTGGKPFFCYKCNNREFLARKAAYRHVNRCKGTIMQDQPSSASKGKVKLLPSKLSSTPTLKPSVLKPFSHGQKCCPKCSKAFKNGIGLSNHLRTCKGKRKCFFCLKLISRPNFKKHILQCNVMSTISLPAEEKTVLPSQVLSSESISAVPLTPTPRRNAPITDVVDMSVKELVALHVDSSGKLSNMVCKLCDKQLGSRKSLYGHYLKHSSKVYHCKSCNIRMCLRSTYEAHMVNFHSDQDHKSTDESKSSSPLSSATSVKSKAASKFMGFKTWKLKCEFCQKVFSSAVSLNYHKQSHKKVKCKICEITFPASMEKSHICTPKVKEEPNISSQDANNFSKTGNKTEGKSVLFTCHLCQKKFHTRKMLYQHKKMHIKVKIYKCKICDNSYSDSGALQLHKVTEHPDEIEQEKIAADKVLTEQPTASSVNKTATRNPFECSICHKVYSGKDSLSRHMKLHNGGLAPMFVGGEAVAVVKPQAPGLFFCSLCDRAFDSKVSFLGHKGWHSRHLSGSSVTPLDKDSSISSVENVNISTVSSETIPAKSSSNSDYFKCQLCNKRFSSKKNLNSHMTYHKKGLLKVKSKPSKEQLKPVVTLQNILPLPKNIHRCKVCFKSFSEESSLNMHMRVHSKNPSSSGKEEESAVIEVKQEPMTCKLCNKEYRSQKSLKSHMMGHSGEKPFKCRSCSNRYSNSKALSKHEKERHSNILRPFSCSRCTTSFMMKEDLLAHYEKCTH